MGCAISRPPVKDGLDGIVKKCERRMSLMQNAINHREDFAMAHIAYIQSLAKVGLALKRFTEGEYMWVASSPPRVVTSPASELPRLALTATEVPEWSSASSISPLPSNISKPVIGNSILQKDLSLASPSISPIHSPSMVPLPTSEGSSSHDMTYSLRRAESLPARLSDEEYEEEYDDDYDYYGNPPQPSSLLADSSWFSRGTFTPPVIPEHLKEQRRMKQFDVNGSITPVQDNEGMLLENEETPVLEEIPSEGRDVRGNGPNGKEEIVVEVESSIEEVGALDKDMEESSSEQVKTEPSIHEAMVIAEYATGDNTETEFNDLYAFRGENIPQIMEHVNNLFIRASKSGHDVSMMLEMQSDQHAKSLRDSLKTFNAITSYWSQKASIIIKDMHEDNEFSGCGMAGSHVSTLERLCAWERKLYDEINGSENILKEFNQKRKELHVLESNNGDRHDCGKMRATVKKLDTQLTVALKVIQVTSAKIQDLANDQLFPQLCELLEGSVKMWKMMQECHELQEAISSQLHNLQRSVEDAAATESSDIHKVRSVELRHELEAWRKHFQDWMSTQKKYVNNICEWLEICYGADEMERLPMLYMMMEWKKSIGDLETAENVSGSISSFIATFRYVEENILDELKFKKQVDKLRKLLHDHSLILQKLEKEHTGDIPDSRPGSSMKSKLMKVRTRVGKFKDDVENHESKHSKAVQERKSAVLDVLRQSLPSLFMCLSLFSKDASNMYQRIMLTVGMRYNSDTLTES